VCEWGQGPSDMKTIENCPSLISVAPQLLACPFVPPCRKRHIHFPACLWLAFFLPPASSSHEPLGIQPPLPLSPVYELTQLSPLPANPRAWLPAHDKCSCESWGTVFAGRWAQPTWSLGGLKVLCVHVSRHHQPTALPGPILAIAWRTPGP